MLFCILLFAEHYESPNGYDLEYPPCGDFQIANHYDMTIDLTGQNNLEMFNYNRYINTNNPNIYLKIVNTSMPVECELYIDGIEVYHNNIDANNQPVLLSNFALNAINDCHKIEFKINAPMFCISTFNLLESETPQFSVVPQNDAYQDELGDVLYILQRGNSQIKKPLLFVDGDDPINSMSRYWYWKNRLPEYLSSVSNLDQYDIYLLTFNNCRQDARISAMITLMASQFVHNQYQNDLVEGNVLAGFSLGGIVSRYSLAFAEENRIPHYCKQYIAIDSPQRGAVVNSALQKEISYLINEVETGTIVYQNSMGNKYKQLKLIQNGFNSCSAKQMIRTNIYGSNAPAAVFDLVGDIIPSSDFLSFFSEINLEDRMDYTNNHGPAAFVNQNLLNNDTNYTNCKPGFPYKQNNINSVAISNGMLQKSGNIFNNSWLVTIDTEVSEWIAWACNGRLHHVNSLPYDCQPGSTSGFEDSPGQDYKYDAILAPLRSSLYLKAESVKGRTNTDSQLPYLNYNEILIPAPPISYPNMTAEEYLADHSYFDQVYFKSDDGISSCYPDPGRAYNWDHEVDNDSNIGNNVMYKALDYSQRIENRVICMISGQIFDPNPELVTIKPYINNIELPITQTYSQVNSDGSFSIPYTLIKDNNIVLKFYRSGTLVSSLPVHAVYNSVYCYAPNIEHLRAYTYQYQYGNIHISPTGDFHTINEAIGYLKFQCENSLYDHTPIVITVEPKLNNNEPYNETINFDLLAGFQIPSLTLQGSNRNVMISGGDPSHAVISCSTIKNVIIKNLSISGQTDDILGGITLYGSIESAKLEDCTVSDCISRSGYQNGIGLNCSVPIIITGCEFSSNCGDNPSVQLKGGAICLSCSAPAISRIENCTISNNTASNAGAILISGTSEKLISGCIFADNYANWFSESARSSVILCEDASNVEICNNLIYSSEDANLSFPDMGIQYGIFAKDSGSQNHIIYIHHNTIYKNDRGIYISRSSGNLYGYSTLTNNIISNFSDGIVVNNIPNSRIQMSYNDVYHYSSNPQSNNIVGYNVSPLANPGMIYAEPAIGDDFVPKWTNSIISPCIDAGNPMELDPDGTPSDIGARIAINHAIERYSFTDPDPDKWYWISFPILDRITDNATSANSFFELLLELYDVYQNSEWVLVPKYLEEISWMKQGNPHNIIWNSNQWYSDMPNHLVTSEQGYKIKLQGNPISLTESGFNPDTNTTIELLSHYESWLGYTMQQSMYPQDAFSSIWDDLAMIKTKDWCMSRIDDNTWLSASKIYPLNYGDMVEVIPRHNCNFHWANQNPVNPDKKPEPTKFIFPEKQDYVPVYINLKDVEMNSLKEIGLYVDSVCKGAVVVTDSLVQLSAFLDVTDVMDSTNTEFIFYYESKSQPQEMKTIHLTQNMMKKSLINDDPNYPVYQVDIRNSDVENPQVVKTMLFQNYPNPFNPSTTISFNLKNDANISLDIYNIKGQLVKNLESGFKPTGSYKSVWDGKDRNGNICASGVYLYRLKTGDTCITHKMMMLK